MHIQRIVPIRKFLHLSLNGTRKHRVHPDTVVSIRAKEKGGIEILPRFKIQYPMKNRDKDVASPAFLQEGKHEKYSVNSPSSEKAPFELPA